MSEPWLVCVGARIDRYSAGDQFDSCDPERDALADELAELAESAHDAEVRQFGALLGYLPPLEQQVVRLHLRGFPHEEIGRRVGITKQASLYRMGRAMTRLRFLVSTGHAEFAATLDADLCSAGLAGDEASALAAYYRANSYAVVARALGKHVDVVRQAIHRGLEALREAGPRYARHVELFEALRSRPNLLAEMATQPRRAAARRHCTPLAEEQCTSDASGVPHSLRDVSAAELGGMQVLANDGWPLERIAEHYRLDAAYARWLLTGEWVA